jgi:MFS transporter, putative metabolite:H+ symporter
VPSGRVWRRGVPYRGAGSAYSLSRLAAAAMPYVLLPLLNSSTPNAVFLFIAGVMAALIVDVALLGPRTTGRRLEDLDPGDETAAPGSPAQSTVTVRA